MASSKFESKRSSLLRLSPFQWAKQGEKDFTVVVKETPVISPEPSRPASLSTEPDVGISETGVGSSGDTAVRSPCDCPDGGTTSKAARPRVSRRQSMIDMVSSLWPSLTSSTAGPSVPQQPSRQQTHRKPVPSPPPTSPPPVPQQVPQQAPQQGYWQPVVPIQIGWAVPMAPVPLAPTHTPPLPPPKVPFSHTRNSSLPSMLKKDPKDAQVPSVPQVMATQASPPQHRRGRGRSESPTRSVPGPAKLQTNRLQPDSVPGSSPRGRSSSAQPPTNRYSSVDAPRTASSPANAVPPSATSSDAGDSPGGRSKRKSWLPGFRSRSNSEDEGKGGKDAWIMVPGNRVDYNLNILVNAEKVPELWSESSSVYVHLFPKSTGRGPSFKVADTSFGSSAVLFQLLLDEAANRGSDLLTAGDAVRSPLPRPAAGEGRLYLPLKSTDLESLVAARNLFAFLTGQPLVATKANPNMFSALLQVGALLREFGFSSSDGSHYGFEVEEAFDALVEQYHLDDVRNSREKTIEALILAETMRSWRLYEEAFTHAVGKYDSLIDLGSPLFSSISIATRNRMERSHLDLQNRRQNVNLRLENFEFPSLFAGVASSTSQFKTVKFKHWNSSFHKMRNFTLAYYKDLFGNWPPRAKSKKNQFSVGGLNRVALQMLYWDLCSLYDLLVDREAPTDRKSDDKTATEDDTEEDANPAITALRTMLTEFDHSSPPVLPPVPYDVPKLPRMTAIHENYNSLPAKKQAKLDKHLQSNELQIMLIKSHNIDKESLDRPFLNAFKDFEQKEARGVSPHDLPDQRIGYWLFLYAVLQSLPMLVVDAPGLRWTKDVEYFLCQAPQGNAPWMEDAGVARKMWYRAAGGQNLVELSTDVVLFSVEGIYRRSHCWEVAKRWGGTSAVATPNEGRVSPGAPEDMAPLEPPRAVFQDMDPVMGGRESPTGSPRLRARNPATEQAYRLSVAMGLEPLAAGEFVERTGSAGHQSRQSSISGASGFGHGRPGSAAGNQEGGSTFDDILKGMEGEGKKKKRGFF
ncbi:hypothetical protein OQA88_3589 [Cercophora sp. LCS_1]